MGVESVSALGWKTSLYDLYNIARLGLGKFKGIFGEFNNGVGMEINPAKAKWLEGRKNPNYFSGLIQKYNINTKTHKKRVDGI